MQRVRKRPSPSEDLQRPVLLLDRHGSALHPIAVIHVQDGSDHAIISAMYVSADHTVGFVLARGREYRSIAEVSKELEGSACRVTEVIGERASFRGIRLKLAMVPIMNPLRARVCLSPYHRDQTIWIERAVELMPMDHKHPGTVSGGVD